MCVTSLLNNIHKSGFQVYIDWGKELCIYLKIKEGNNFHTVYHKLYDNIKYDGFDKFMLESLTSFNEWFIKNENADLKNIIKQPNIKAINEYQNWIY